jgi:hypothetical protein
MAVSKWSLWTWPLAFCWFAYQLAVIGPTGHEDGISVVLLAAANVAFWSDVYRDIKGRGYKLERLHRDG